MNDERTVMVAAGLGVLAAALLFGTWPIAGVVFAAWLAVALAAVALWAGACWVAERHGLRALAWVTACACAAVAGLSVAVTS